MNLREKILNDCSDNLKLFDYYKSIGCTDNQALVLSLYSYSRNSYWYNDLKAFQFYYDLYMKDKDRKESLCDFIANKILSVEGVSLDKALENAKEYKEHLELEEERKNRQASLDSFGDFESSSIRGVSSSGKRKGVFGSFFGASKKAKSVDNSITFASMATENDFEDNAMRIEPEYFFNSVEPEETPMSMEELLASCDTSESEVQTCCCVASNNNEEIESESFESEFKSESIVNQVSEVIVKDFMEKTSTDRYEVIEEKGFLSPLTSPTSTFRMTSNTAAFGVLRKNKGNSRALKESMVRIEELLNNFEYKLSKPTNRMFNINTQICEKPNSKNKLLFVGVQGKDIIPQRQNITLLLDTSGSMSGNNVWTQAAMITIVKQLKENDVLSLVTYSDNDHTVFANLKIDADSFDKFIETLYSVQITGCTWGSKGIETAYELANKTYIQDGINRVILMTDGDLNFGITDKSFDKFIELLYNIEIKGCTWGSKGIETAYELANKTYIEDGINRVILMTDGDLNFGITDKGGLKDLILSKKDKGIFLSVLGTGLYNYKDDTLETLSKNGNGNYCTIDCIEDVKENIFEKYNSLVFTIAKDVKAQVEFNPKFVKSYRLIGYENRALNHEDFRNDAVISEPFGCGSYGVALYELEMQNGVAEIKSDLKYQQPVLTDADSICTVSVRYKEPLATESQELSVEVKNKTTEMKDNLLLAYLITVIGERLRNSEYYNEKDKKFVTDMVYKNGLGDLYDKNAEKFQTLMSFIEK